MSAPSLKPKYEIGKEVYYVDHHDRPQTGKVQRIDGHWTGQGSAYLVYTLDHPTYKNKVCYRAEENILSPLRRR